LYILGELPSNFETEFGIDEEVELCDKNGKVLYTLRKGLYKAFQEEGYVHCEENGENYSYFVKIKVGLK